VSRAAAPLAPSPYFRPASLDGPFPGLTWRQVLRAVARFALGCLAAPAIIGRLAVQAHAIVPEIFVAAAVLAGGALALLFTRLDS
jgi:hypothetical protein